MAFEKLVTDVWDSFSPQRGEGLRMRGGMVQARLPYSYPCKSVSIRVQVVKTPINTGAIRVASEKAE